jgi:hypothetical protein
MKNKIILVDCDGVLLDWEWAFHIWMTKHKYVLQHQGKMKYDISKQYAITKEQAVALVKTFNESAAIGFLPPLRDAQHYVKRLHEEHGYVFHAITSLSKDTNAQKLRKMNVSKIFGETVFDRFIMLDTGAEKNQALEQYQGTGYYWIEDKITNAVVGHALGLKSLLVEHGHNMDFEHVEIPRVKSWKEIYRIIVDNAH